MLNRVHVKALGNTAWLSVGTWLCDLQEVSLLRFEWVTVSVT
jgi:hypothetical protein